MTALADKTTAVPHPGMGMKQFIAFVAALMAVNALAIDSMLPALPKIASSLGVQASNQQQWIVTAYLLGFGAAQIVYGPLADRFGRKPVLVVGLLLYAACSLLAAGATTMPLLLTARVVQGIGSAATRVLAVSVVRDCYSGSRMAQVMSFTFIVFLAVPILAPSIGQVIMLFGPWRLIFVALALFALAVIAWMTLRLPETLHPDDRIPIEPRRVANAFRIAITNRLAVGYMLAMTMVMGGLFGFINSAQQVFADVFGQMRLFTVIFALIAAFMALASLINANIVRKMGPRRVSHGALLLYIVLALAHVVIALAGWETLWSFSLLQAGQMFCFGLVASNFGALAMGPLGHIAGTASSLQGFVTTLGGALIGFFTGQQFNGTTLPLAIGFAVTGVIALACVLFAENGALFRAAQPFTDAGRTT